MAFSLPRRDLEPTVAAIHAMADSAYLWARELINSNRDLACLDCKVFPTLDVPATVSSEEVDLSSSLTGIFDDNIEEHDADAPHCLSDDE